MFDLFLSEYPARYPGDILYYNGSFHSIFVSSSTFFYNPELKTLVEEFNLLWNESLSFAHHYESKGQGYYAFTSILSPSNEATKDYEKMRKIGKDLNITFQKLLELVRVNYLEIDLEKTSKKAYEKKETFSFNTKRIQKEK